MRTNIEINDELMADIMATGRFKTKREAVEAGLTLVKRQDAYRELLKMAGTVQWGWPGDEHLKRRPNWYRVDADGNELPADDAPEAAHGGR
jgi:antitoxin ParD1/3/4